MGKKKVKGRKRQFAVDTCGNLLAVAVQAANVQDRDGAEAILNELHELCPDVRHAWADASYRGEIVEEVARGLGITIEIVTRADDQVGFQVQPRRWVVERSIAWANRCQRLSKEYERDVINSAAWIYWASIQRLVKRIAPNKEQERPYKRNKRALKTNTTSQE